ncbi:unnamed protein product [Peniophora sp. CBMAI 1063]|nr:unnamed protein product [Peniophora sp. CBMAI 1063]
MEYDNREAVAELRHRRSMPDVPSDIDDQSLMEHFNDPNYDFDAQSYSSTYFTDRETGTKGFSEKRSSFVGTTDMETESQLSSSWPAGSSKGDFAGEEYQDDSPYPEVRAAVSNVDDPNMPASTIRAWIIGFFVTVIVSGYNSFIQFRYPFVLINALLIQVAVYPIGLFCARVLPAWRINIFGFRASLNPGPFSIKEHALITMMGNVVINASNVSDVVNVEFAFFNNAWPFGQQLALSLAVQLIGFGASGFVRQFLVWPASMIWPGILVRTALLGGLHKTWGLKEVGHRVTRARFFGFVMLGSFVWYFIPGYLFTALSYFNWPCWIAPENIVVNSLFGTVSGLGMGLLTFDWSQITFFNSPLVVPFWAQLNVFVAFVIMIWFVAPIMWAKNVWHAQFMPISGAATYDNTGNYYNASAILTNNLFDEVKYQQYSPMFMPIVSALTWGCSFAVFGGLIVHTFLWYRKDLARQFRSTLRNVPDVHSRLMANYSEVPRWWYGALGVIAFALGIVGNEVAHTGLPVWAYIVGVLVGIIFILPMGILNAVSNQLIDLSVLAELMAGFMVPGNPVANMVFKTLTYSVTYQALMFTGDAKMGHYLKVPPRAMFSAQVFAAVVGVFASVGAQTWALYNINDICDPDQPQMFNCPLTSVFESSALLWGNIGPKRVFGPGSTYYPVLWFFLIGTVLPIPFYLLARRYPRSIFRYIHAPLAIGTLVIVPPATGINFASFFLVGAIFQWFIRRRHFRWWMRYNYLLSSGLDAGVIIAMVVIFFCLQLPKEGSIVVSWWGNDFWQTTADALGTPLKLLAPGEIFGPSQWS